MFSNQIETSEPLQKKEIVEKDIYNKKPATPIVNFKDYNFLQPGFWNFRNYMSKL